MIINHNLSALNAWRALSINTANTQKALEKLSSGYRINRAGDDAAGLAISEKMRAQIRGLEMASRNAQDAISLIQTAEGALNETHSILQRMRELAVQAANDTNTESDRAEIQKEIDQLAQELARIGNTTEFNTQRLLDGTFQGTFHIGANENQNLTLQISDMRGFSLGVVGNVYFEVEGTVSDGTNSNDDNFAVGTYKVTGDATNGYKLVDSTGKVIATSSDGQKYTLSTSDDTISFSIAITSGSVTVYKDSDGTLKATTTQSVTNNGLEAGTYTYDATAGVLKDSNGKAVAKYDQTKNGFTDINDNTKTLFTLDSNFTLSDGDTFTVRGIDVTTQTAANTAITTIERAIETVSTERSKLGAYQNRLEHTINNLGVATENLTAAESRIRDVDMAKAMMEFTKNNILQQAATAMLAQANQLPQTVLQLLR